MRIQCRHLELGGLSSLDEDVYFVVDLEYLKTQYPSATGLQLRMAYCEKDHTRMDHSIVVAVNGAVPYDSSDDIAALPCPPHCGGEKGTAYETTKFKDYDF